MVISGKAQPMFRYREWFNNVLVAFENISKETPAGNIPIAVTKRFCKIIRQATKGAAIVGIEVFVVRHPRWNKDARPAFVAGIVWIDTRFLVEDCFRGRAVYERPLEIAVRHSTWVRGVYNLRQILSLNRLPAT